MPPARSLLICANMRSPRRGFGNRAAHRSPQDDVDSPGTQQFGGRDVLPAGAGLDPHRAIALGQHGDFAQSRQVELLPRSVSPTTTTDDGAVPPSLMDRPPMPCPPRTASGIFALHLFKICEGEREVIRSLCVPPTLRDRRTSSLR
jgi:hypothetical protein